MNASRKSLPGFKPKSEGLHPQQGLDSEQLFTEAGSHLFKPSPLCPVSRAEGGRSDITGTVAARLLYWLEPSGHCHWLCGSLRLVLQNRSPHPAAPPFQMPPAQGLELTVRHERERILSPRGTPRSQRAITSWLSEPRYP